MTEKVSQNNGTVWYWCQGCNSNHRVIVVGPVAWSWNCDLEKPTFSPSVFVNPGGDNPTVPRCHHFVEDGKIKYLDDCTHELRGQTVEMEDF